MSKPISSTKLWTRETLVMALPNMPALRRSLHTHPGEGSAILRRLTCSQPETITQWLKQTDRNTQVFEHLSRYRTSIIG